MKTKKLATTERYSQIAVRAKLSVEVEQRKRLGAWGKRVLVLDGSTLYAYKTKGDGGSVGGWEVGGADVHVGRGNESRDDGRHLLVIARPPAYKLTFSFTTTYEQARMIQALSSSGAIVTGLDAIMLLKNLRKQQEEAQREEEERQRQMKEQKEILEGAQGEAETGETSNDDTLEVDENVEENVEEEVEEEPKIEVTGYREEEEVEEISQSVYEMSSGGVSNPLYSLPISAAQMRAVGDGDYNEGESSHAQSHSSDTSEASKVQSEASDLPTANQNAEGKVNPLPKPPRSLTQDRRPSVSEDKEEKTLGDSEAQSCQSSSGVGESRDGEKGDPADSLAKEGDHTKGLVGGDGDLDFRDESDSENELVEARNSAYSDDEDEEDEVSETEGFYEVNKPEDKSEPEVRDSESEREPYGKSESDSEKEEIKESDSDQGKEKPKESKEESEDYTDLIARMRLERGFSIDSSAGGSPQNHVTPDVFKEDAVKTPTDSPTTSPSDSPIPQRTLVSEKTYDEEEEKREESAGNGEEWLSDSEEQFEKLYKELSQNNERVDGGYDRKGTQLESLTEIPKTEITPSSPSLVKKSRDETDSPAGKAVPGKAQVKKVNSIIKKDKKGSDSNRGSTKRVQFSLEVETIEPSSDHFETTASEDVSQGPISPSKKTQDPDTSKKKKDGKNKEILGTITAKDKKQEEPGSPKKKQPTTSPPSSPSKKATPGSPSKKKPQQTGTEQVGTITSPTKKKGIFSSIFSPSQSKKGETQVAKDDTTTTTTTTVKKATTETSPPSLKRQPTVDFNAPLIISGQVEMGGSVGGRLSGRRVEVRDGHLLAYLPRAASAPASRLKLTGLSVMPVLGAGQSNTLVLSRAARVMMVIKLCSREEMMKWITALSDEVIKATPEDQRVGLTLYPSPKKEEEENREKEEEEEEEEAEKDKEEKSEKVGERKDTVAQDLKSEEEVIHIALTNGHTEVREVPTEREAEKNTPNQKNREVSTEQGLQKKTLNQKNKNHKHLNGRATQDDLKVTGRVSSRFPGPKRSISVDHLNEIKEKQKLTRQNGQRRKSYNEYEEKIGSQVQKKIQQFSGMSKEKDVHIKQGPQKTHDTHIKQSPQKTQAGNQKQNEENKRHHHPPLRRLSGQGKVSPQPHEHGKDTVDNFLMVNSLLEHSASRHDQCVHENKVDFIRYVSSSNSSLASATDIRRESHSRPLQRYGSSTISQAKQREKPDGLVGSKSAQDKKQTTLSRDSGSRASATEEAAPQHSTSTTPSPPPSPSPSHTPPTQPAPLQHHQPKPRTIETVEKRDENPSPVEVTRVNERKVRGNSESWYEKTNTEETTIPVPQEEREVPRITWSVAATREKFELLSRVSGENRGKLTTKTPIARKRSNRGTVKKKRSLEGANVSRRASVRRNGAKASLQVSDSYTSSSQELHADTLDTDTSFHDHQDTPSLPQVSQLRRNFEGDRLSSSSPTTDTISSTDDLTYNKTVEAESSPQKEKLGPKKSPLRRTSNILQEPYSSSSSPEPDYITSRKINARPHDTATIAHWRRAKSPSLQSSRSVSRDNDVVICWRGPYIAQAARRRDTKLYRRDKERRRGLYVETEQRVLANISNAFLAKRRLLAREVAVGRIQERLAALEERQWEIQAAMAELDTSSVQFMKGTREWKNLEKSLKVVEEETEYWNGRLVQTQKEAEQARQKLAAALSSSLAQHSLEPPDKGLMQEEEQGEEEEEEEDGAFEDASEA